MALIESPGKSSHVPNLELLDITQSYGFTQPKKRINESEDVSAFLVSKGYGVVMTFLMQLNRSMFPSYLHIDGEKTIQTWEIGSTTIKFSKAVLSLRELMAKLELIIDEAPPDAGPRRFGNVSFRKWYDILRERASELLDEHLPHEVFEFDNTTPRGPGPQAELEAYFLGSFGSSQRLDYGTGHELSFLAFMGCIWKLGGFEKAELGVEERGIVIGIFEPYLNLCRKLIKTYTLEPAGSHGVWGLDDHFFLPYVFGSAQFGPAISDLDPIPLQGSGDSTPDPSGVAEATIVAAERDRNMYFSAVGFIYDVKRGPFWEHSPMLFDISGVRAGWAKINKGMLKMYNAEVLSKFPVVQHFPFGSLFSFDHDPNAKEPNASTHILSQPSTTPGGPPSSSNLQAIPSTKAPWVSTNATGPPPTTGAPWATSRTQAPLRDGSDTSQTPFPARREPPLRDPMRETGVPWSNPSSTRQQPPTPSQMPSTRAPWATGNTTTQPPSTRFPVRPPSAQPDARSGPPQNRTM